MNTGKITAALSSKKNWTDFLTISIGMFLAAAAVYYFLVPSKLIIGNVSGLAIVIHTVLANAGIALKVSYIVLILNALLLILAYMLIGPEFGVKTAYAALVLGPLMDLWEAIYPFEKLMEPGTTSVMGDIWLDLLCFVLVLSASQAILFRINASTGGLDIVAKIFNIFFHFDMGTCVTIAGVVVSLSGFAIHPFRMVVIGLIGTWINGLIVNYFMASLSRRKRVCVITDESDRVREFIVNNIVRGCSLYEVTGGYSGVKRKEIQSLLTQDEFASLMKFIRDNDIEAFITAGNVSEVYGLWSQHKKLKKEF